MDPVSTAAAADALWKLWSTGEQVDYLAPDQTPADLDEAWRIHRALESHAGGRIGWKVAATSPRSQAHLGLNEPMAGAFYRGVLIEPGVVIAPTHMRIIEAEFAFRMQGRLDPSDAPFDRPAVLGHVAAIHAGLEVPDARLGRYPNLTPPEMVADFMLTRYYCVGDQLDVDPGALAGVEVKLWRDDQPEDEGTGADVLGDPVNALFWLVNFLARRQEAIEEGDVITTGACAVAYGVEPGQTISAEFASGHRLSVGFST